MGTDTLQRYHENNNHQGTNAIRDYKLRVRAKTGKIKMQQVSAKHKPTMRSYLRQKNIRQKKLGVEKREAANSKHSLISQNKTKPYSACIVLPTYNEASNIKPTLDSIYHRHKLYESENDEKVRLDVLVVDDNSPDGTADIVRTYGQKNRRVHLLLRKEKNGLGAAYIAGMQHAMRTLKPDAILEMDADGQHNPADIHRLINETRKGADFVIGSRYIPGGSVPQAWRFHRRLISRAANAYTKMILSTGNAKDCTGGFRAIRTDLLERIDFNHLQVKGYAFQVTLLDACVRQGAVVKEIPIHFLERLRGESKMRPKDMISGGIMLANMRLQRMFSAPDKLQTDERLSASISHKSGAKRLSP